MSSSKDASPTSSAPVAALGAELRSGRVLYMVVAGLLVGLLQIAQSASFAALIFEGALSPLLARGIGMALFASAVGLIVMTLLTSLPLSIGGAQNVPAAILGVAAAALAASIADPDSRFVTVIAAVVITTLATGVFLLALGTFRLAGLVRFLPYPVVGGFLAGTGWLMLIGGLGSMAGTSVSLWTLPSLFTDGTIAFWLPGLVLGIVILALSRHITHPLFLPIMIAGTVIGFYAVAWLTGQSAAELGAAGWLLGPFPDDAIWQPLLPGDLAVVEWSAIFRQTPSILAAVAMSGIALLLNASALELSLNRDIDMNREMRAAGWSNLVATIGSGMTGYQQLGLTTLNANLGVTGRLTGLVAAVVCVIGLVAGGRLLELIPTMVFGAILVYLGLSFLYQWVIDAWDQIPAIDHAIILLILVVIAAVGFLEGVVVGVLATIIMFVVNYSVVDVVKNSLTAGNYRSRVTRPPHQLELLDQYGDQISILTLQGFLFFGTANNLLEKVKKQVQEQDGSPVRFLLIDFSRVTGLDSTALLSFTKMQQVAAAHDLTLVFSQLSPALAHQIAAGGIVEDGETVLIFPSMDRGLEWCEDRLLEHCGCQPYEPLPPLLQQLSGMVEQEIPIERLLTYLDREELSPGTYLIRKGDPADVMYLIESGQITAQITLGDGTTMRLETMLGGRVVGEMGFYLGQERSADVVVEAPTVVYSLTKEALAQMEAEDPDVAAAFHRLIIRMLSDRVSHLMGTVEALQH